MDLWDLSTLYFLHVFLRSGIFSTYVEVFLLLSMQCRICLYFLHVCGGVSAAENEKEDTKAFSPRMWRCFFTRHKESSVVKIFSTYVEVFPLELIGLMAPQDFLHVCGGVSIDIAAVGIGELFSPRMWRCF